MSIVVRTTGETARVAAYDDLDDEAYDNVLLEHNFSETRMVVVDRLGKKRPVPVLELFPSVLSFILPEYRESFTMATRPKAVQHALKDSATTSAQKMLSVPDAEMSTSTPATASASSGSGGPVGGAADGKANDPRNFDEAEA